MTTELPIAVVDHPVFDEHRAPSPHPERPERLAAARQGLAHALEPSQRLVIDAPEIDTETLAKVHPRGFLRALDDALAEGEGYLDGDTYFCGATREAARRAAGGAVALVDTLLAGRASRGLALLRPPGHHALPKRPMGFCLFNNVAIAAVAALDRGVERVAIVDWDVHHGNGTQAIFEADPRVLFVSLHQWPLYPGTGAPDEIGFGPGKGKTLNVALPPGTSPDGYGAAFRELVVPAVSDHAPGLLLVSAGFDAHERDPLAEMSLDDASFEAMASALLDAVGPEVPAGVFLEGGYDLQAVEHGVRGVTRALAGERRALPDGRPSEAERAALERVRRGRSTL